MRLLNALVVVSTLLMTACTSMPNTDVGKRAYLEKVMPAEQAIKFHAKADLYRNTFEISIGGINRAETVEFLELVLTENTLLFYEWRDDAHEYNLRHRYSIEDISRLKEGSYITRSYIALKIENEYIAFFVWPDRHANTLRAIVDRTGLPVESE